MKTLLSFLSLALLAGSSIKAQITYSDDFDKGILSINSSPGYTPSLSNNMLLLTANGSADLWESLSYKIHMDGVDSNTDASAVPKLYIKAKGTDLPNLRIDLRDANGYVTNFSGQSTVLIDEFKIYELNYEGKLLDGGYGGPCLPADAPCPVDATQISNLEMFINPGVGGYNGTIEIEWISLGAPLEDIPSAPEFDIRYNQVSYLKGRDKLINIVSINSFSSKSYTVYDSADNAIISGTTDTSVLWSDSGEYVATVDVSSIDTEGTYRFVIDELEINFTINNDGYQEIREQAFKYYYYNRASTSLTADYAGIYARNAGHPDTDVIIHASAASPARPAGTKIAAPKGWYDAGDYNKYIVNSGISTYTLLAAYEHYDTYYKNLEFNIPEKGNAIPDILDETIWNLDWMLAMQDPNDGGVYHKLTGLNFSGNIMPDQYTFDRYVVQKTTAAALNFAAVTAVASRIFADFEAEKPGYSATLLQASKDAYSWAKANPTVYYVQPSDVKTGEYGDNNVTDEFQWAAVELFISTKDIQYKNDINIANINAQVPTWSSSSMLALFSIAHHASELSGDINVSAANNKLLETANVLKNNVDSSPMNITMTTPDYVWGSNGQIGNQLFVLIRAYELTGDESYLSATYKSMDYIFGRNGTGYCYVTGFGNRKVIDPHHRISVSDGIAQPVPGMIVGGPHPGQQDSCSGYPNANPASSFVDNYCSYSTNEITINWNAPLVYSIHALYNYQNESSVLSVTDNFDETLENIFEVYPNPANKVLHIKTAITNTSPNIELYSILGKKIFSKQLKDTDSAIDITNLSPGLYLAKITTKTHKYTAKILKK
ncbi:glycoside hydrolase family 9 protein [Aquimarina sp. RZ0]|uniref:glycoside hydrolase family 9 protein n=1 Tax=Aquimarina sp. RZ0 TaxID=2607730 RepID=UPI0011F18504|nr:glycoside hydrolase family 9 protein [Aquimarina sp. RZ0]KAA1246543.1 T9SS type A sorting domain-containing protein [Aquimarina sp. RZ0]